MYKTSSIPLAVATQKVYPMFTYRIESKRLEGTVTNMKTNLNHGKLVSAFIFF